MYKLLMEIPTDLRDVIHEISSSEDCGDAAEQRETEQPSTESSDVKPTDVMYFYYSEMEHREETFWKMSLQLFVVGLAVNLAPFADLDVLSISSTFPSWTFPLVGALIAQIFLVVSKGYAARLKASTATYRRVTDALPAEYRRDVIQKFNHGLSNGPLSYIMVLVMYLALMVTSVITLVTCILQ